MLTGWKGRGMRLVSSHSSSIVLGAVLGFLVGALLGAILLGSGTPNDLLEGFTTIPVFASVVWTTLGWAAGGWLIGGLVQAFGVPDGVEGDEAEESAPVQRRLSTAFGLPAVAAVAILALVLPVAWVFISFPGWAPLTGSFIAGSILGFAGLSASRPGMKVTAGEFLVAAAGIGAVVIIIASVLAIQGGGHGDDDGHSESHAVLSVL